MGIGLTNTLRKASLMFLCIFVLSSCNSKDNIEGFIEEGRSEIQAGRFNDAIISLSKAESAAQKHSDDYSLGLVYHEIAKVYDATCGYFEEITYLQKASDAFSRADKPYSSRNMLFESGLAHYKCKDYESASEIFNRVLKESSEVKDTLLQASCLSAFAALMLDVSPSRPEIPLRMVTKISNDLKYPLSSRDRGVLAYAYALSGDYSEADVWLKKAIKTANTPEEMSQARYREFQVKVHEGNDTQALAALRHVAEYESSVEQMALRRSVAAAREDFLKRQSIYMSDRYRLALLWGAAMVFMLLAVVFAIIGFFRYKRLQDIQLIAQEKSETEKYMSLAEELNGRLKTVSEEKAVAGQIKNDGIASVMKSRYDTLERLCEQYYIYEGTENLQSKVFKEVKTLIDGLREDEESLLEMEKTLNMTYNNVVLKLKAQVVNLKEDDIRLYIFAASGLSSTAISTIMEKDKSLIYNRLYRLKGKIQASEASDKDLILSLLSH